MKLLNEVLLKISCKCTANKKIRLWKEKLAHCPRESTLIAMHGRAKQQVFQKDEQAEYRGFMTILN